MSKSILPDLYLFCTKILIFRITALIILTLIMKHKILNDSLIDFWIDLSYKYLKEFEVLKVSFKILNMQI